MKLLRTLSALLALLLAAALLASCGDDDDSAAGDDAPGETASADDSDDDADGGDSFPVTVEHKYGSTTIESKPERVVSVGFTEQDSLLALGVVPVGIRDWYGDHPFAVWPWAQDELGDAEPEVLSATEINFEAVAALRPDLIVGVSSGMTDQEYATLSEIAPTITQSDDYVDYGVPWQEAHRMIGQAVGESELAEEQVTEIEDRFAEIAEAHPDWEGKEATVSFVMSESTIGAYNSQDGRSRLLTALGFVIPDEIDQLAGDQFYSEFSLEEIERLDRDLLVWIGVVGDLADQVTNHPLHGSLAAVREGREIFWSDEIGGAAGFSSPLSLPYLLDELVPQLEAAMDGDPATEVPAA